MGYETVPGVENVDPLDPDCSDGKDSARLLLACTADLEFTTLEPLGPLKMALTVSWYPLELNLGLGPMDLVKITDKITF